MTDMNADDAAVATGLSAGDTRLTTITAKDFVEQGYAERVAKGECKVFYPVDIEYILSFVKYDENGLVKLRWVNNLNQIGSSLYNADLEFSVTWLDTAAPASNGGGKPKYVGYWKLLKDYVKEFEIANKCSFDNSAWDRIKKLEKDIIASVWIERSEAVELEHEHVKRLEAELAAANSALEAERKRVAVCEGTLYTGDAVYHGHGIGNIALHVFLNTVDEKLVPIEYGEIVTVSITRKQAAALDGEKAG